MTPRTLLLTGVLLTAVTAYAQDPPPPPLEPKERTERLTKALDLTADQQVKVRAILEKAEQDRAKLKEDRLAKLKEVSDQIEQVLTPEQKQKYQVLKEKKKKELKDRRQDRKDKKGRHPGPGPESAPTDQKK